MGFRIIPIFRILTSLSLQPAHLSDFELVSPIHLSAPCSFQASFHNVLILGGVSIYFQLDRRHWGISIAKGLRECWLDSWTSNSAILLLLKVFLFNILLISNKYYYLLVFSNLISCKHHLMLTG